MEQVHQLQICVKMEQIFSADIDYFLARKSSLFLTTAGEFKVVDGAPAEIGSTSYPKPLDNAMKLADFDFLPYVRNVKDDTKFYKMNHKTIHNA